jgi:hypothetical protein
MYARTGSLTPTPISVSTGAGAGVSNPLSLSASGSGVGGMSMAPNTSVVGGFSSLSLSNKGALASSSGSSLSSLYNYH